MSPIFILTFFFSLGSNAESGCSPREDNNNIADEAFNSVDETNDERQEQLKNFQKLLKKTNFNFFNNPLGLNPLLLTATAQLAAVVQQQQQQQQQSPPNPFLAAYTNLLNKSTSASPLMSDKLKASRFSPYSKPSFSSNTSSPPSVTITSVINKKRVSSEDETDNTDQPSCH